MYLTNNQVICVQEALMNGYMFVVNRLHLLGHHHHHHHHHFVFILKLLLICHCVHVCHHQD